jgi:dihydropteroate synthase
VSLDEELRRVLPVVEAIASELPVPVSVDTSKPEVMRRAVASGAGFINDVWALREPGALEAAAELAVPVCLMHMRGEPGTMQLAPVYGDVVAEVCGFLRERLDACARGGIPRARLVLDPGFGFGKTVGHNLTLLNRLDRVADIGLPLLVGLSRKSLIGKILDVPVEGRLHGSLALAVLAVARGARIVRAHDVRPTVEALKVADAVLTAS